MNQQTGAVESAEAQIPALQAQARGEMHALAVLLGETPEANASGKAQDESNGSGIWVVQ